MRLRTFLSVLLYLLWFCLNPALVATGEPIPTFTSPGPDN